MITSIKPSASARNDADVAPYRDWIHEGLSQCEAASDSVLNAACILTYFSGDIFDGDSQWIDPAAAIDKVDQAIDMLKLAQTIYYSWEDVSVSVR